MRCIGLRKSFSMSVGSALLIAAAAASADQVRTCAPGEAVQSLDAGGKVATCVPLPPPVDLTPLNARIDAESVARMAADEDLRASTSEGQLIGRYTVVGTGLCYRAFPNGFGTSPEFVPLFGNTVQQQSFTTLGVREFRADGTIHGASTVYNINYPSMVLNAVAPAPSAGGGSVLQFEQDWTYVLGPDRSLTITGAGGHGTVVQGFGGVGNLVETHGAPSLTGTISKDWRTIVLANAAMQVERSVTTTPAGVLVGDVPRVCMRTETLTKID